MENKKKIVKEQPDGVLIPTHEIRIDSEETFLTIEMLEKAKETWKDKKPKKDK